MSDQGCMVCGAFVGHADACPAYVETLESRVRELEAELARLRGELANAQVNLDEMRGVLETARSLADARNDGVIYDVCDKALEGSE